MLFSVLIDRATDPLVRWWLPYLARCWCPGLAGGLGVGTLSGLGGERRLRSGGGDRSAGPGRAPDISPRPGGEGRQWRLATVGAVLLPLEVAGFVTGLACVLLAARISVWNFALGIANGVCFLVLFAQAQIYANGALQLVFIGLGISGWIGWLRGRRDDGSFSVRATPALAWLIGFPVTVLVAGALYWLLIVRAASQQPVWDAATTASSLLAQVLLNRRWVGTWLVWIVTDVALVGLYASVHLWLTAALYVVFTGVAIGGLAAWRRAVGRGAVRA